MKVNYFLSCLYIFVILVSIGSFHFVEAQETKHGEKTVTQERATPRYLYKIISKDEWQKSLVQNKIALSPLDDPFIHLAKEDQVAHVVQKFWNNKDHIILKLKTKKIVGRLIYENNPGGSTKYYHLYDGRIPIEAVEDITFVRANN